MNSPTSFTATGLFKLARVNTMPVPDGSVEPLPKMLSMVTRLFSILQTVGFVTALVLGLRMEQEVVSGKAKSGSVVGN